MYTNGTVVHFYGVGKIMARLVSLYHQLLQHNQYKNTE